VRSLQAPTRGNVDTVEESGLGQARGGKTLQADAERKHGNERRYSNGDAHRGKRVTQHRLAKISRGQFDQVSRLHAGTSAGSSTSFPSRRKIKRDAYRSARGRSCVTISTVVPSL